MTPPVPLHEITAYLDDLLAIAETPDEPQALNGLQVENMGAVDRIVAAVDASQETIDAAIREGKGSPLLLVHHGLFWDGNLPLTGRRMRRVRALLDGDAALYSAHIPLDVHPDLGNNRELARVIGLDVRGWFGDYRGIHLGVWGSLEIARDDLVATLDRELQTHAVVLPGGPEQTARVGVITGGAGSMIAAARDAGLDTFITGEGAHYTYFDAIEWGINAIYAGHYATEQLGVQAVARKLGEEFGLPWRFDRHPTGL